MPSRDPLSITMIALECGSIGICVFGGFVAFYGLTCFLTGLLMNIMNRQSLFHDNEAMYTEAYLLIRGVPYIFGLGLLLWYIEIAISRK